MLGGECVRDESLGEWMLRYSRGDDSAFEPLYRALVPRLYRFCWRLAGQRLDADDLLQETLLRMHRARSSYLHGGNVIHWLFAIARTTHVDRLRRARRRPEAVGTGRDAAEDAQLRSAGHVAAEGAVQARDLLQLVTITLSQMSEKNRSAYVLLHEEGFSVKEAAAVLGASAAVVKQRAHRACEQLRSTLAAEGWKEHGHERSHNPKPLRGDAAPGDAVPADPRVDHDHDSYGN